MSTRTYVVRMVLGTLACCLVTAAFGLNFLAGMALGATWGAYNGICFAEANRRRPR